MPPDRCAPRSGSPLGPGRDAGPLSCPPSWLSMDDDALAGTRVLVIGGNREAAESLRSKLTAAGSPSVDLVPALDLVAAQAAAAKPQIVLCLGDTDVSAVRLRLDPLGLGGGPPVVPLAELAADGESLDAAGFERLRDALELRAAR